MLWLRMRDRLFGPKDSEPSYVPRGDGSLLALCGPERARIANALGSVSPPTDREMDSLDQTDNEHILNL